ncbi:helix-turn-helix domain-containing protein [Acinetobacter populi]|jgi:transcriptional regulator with XRE-family HTH domain|uniref:Transcriptional regulator n=1 Tax=Acinetobacter populi TaxID=1582270 RepID=A0A1Z9YTK5_9GAMM|nr:helix-turn-helix transcriptional regulator [Acinetobacter populi]MCH4247503.1 helix-turn-helix domain-containing protein [Acinetobacter populi]OUY05556.1 transcriptional regulator [Acinetobacter populi]
MNIGQAVRYLRKKKGWTQQQLADYSNTSKSNISNLENGNQGYSPAILEYLARAFHCSVAQLFLLAEYLDEEGKVTKDWQHMPIDTLFMQLPKDVQDNLRQLIHLLLKPE